MTIYYRDEVGEIAVDVDENNIHFMNGECYFSSNGEEYRVSLGALIEIVKY